MDTSHALKIHVPVPAAEPRGAVAAAWAVDGLAQLLHRTGDMARVVAAAARRGRSR